VQPYSSSGKGERVKGGGKEEVGSKRTLRGFLKEKSVIEIVLLHLSWTTERGVQIKKNGIPGGRKRSFLDRRETTTKYILPQVVSAPDIRGEEGGFIGESSKNFGLQRETGG